MIEHRIIRLQIMLDEDELNAVETWRFEKRMPSRASAVRELLRRGLASEGFGVAETGQKSSEFGVINAPEDQNGSARRSTVTNETRTQAAGEKQKTSS